MLSLFQGCLGLSFKNWTGLQYLQDRGLWLSWEAVWKGLLNLQDCKNSYPVHPENHVHSV